MRRSREVEATIAADEEGPEQQALYLRRARSRRGEKFSENTRDRRHIQIRNLYAIGVPTQYAALTLALT
jgi:hypothetical protein